MTSTNPIVRNALKAANGTVEDKYRVTLDTLTLDGKGKTSKVVTAAKLKQILTFLRQSQAFDAIIAQVAKNGSADVAAELPFELNLVVEKA